MPAQKGIGSYRALVLGNRGSIDLVLAKFVRLCNNPPELARCRYCMARVKIAVSLYKVDSPPNCSKSNKFNQFDLTRWRQLGSITYSKRFRLSARVTSHSDVVFSEFFYLSRCFFVRCDRLGDDFHPALTSYRDHDTFFFFSTKKWIKSK